MEIKRSTICMLGNVAYFCRLVIFFSNSFFQKKNIILRISSVTNSLAPDQARHPVGPDLGSNFLQKLSAGDTDRQRVKQYIHEPHHVQTCPGCLPRKGNVKNSMLNY